MPWFSRILSVHRLKSGHQDNTPAAAVTAHPHPLAAMTEDIKCGCRHKTRHMPDKVVRGAGSFHPIAQTKIHLLHRSSPGPAASIGFPLFVTSQFLQGISSIPMRSITGHPSCTCISVACFVTSNAMTSAIDIVSLLFVNTVDFLFVCQLFPEGMADTFIHENRLIL